MAANYQKLYAFLVGKVDDTIKLLDLIAVEGNRAELMAGLVRESLVDALQSAEEMYLNQEEDADEGN